MGRLGVHIYEIRTIAGGFAWQPSLCIKRFCTDGRIRTLKPLISQCCKKTIVGLLKKWPHVSARVCARQYLNFSNSLRSLVVIVIFGFAALEWVKKSLYHSHPSVRWAAQQLGTFWLQDVQNQKEMHEGRGKQRSESRQSNNGWFSRVSAYEPTSSGDVSLGLTPL